MASSLSKLVDNLSEGIRNNKCVNSNYCLDYIKTKNEKLILECYNCKQRYRKKINKELIKRFASTYSFCNNDLNKFILFLRFNETSLPGKESFYSNLNIENIEDIDYRHGNNVFNKFKLNNLGEYHDLYVQSDTLLLADVFENFRDMCLKEYELDPAHFLSLPGLAWQACFKKTGVELLQKLPANGLKWLDSDKTNEINEEFIKNYNENDNKRYILEVDVKYLKGLHKLHSDLPFLSERMEIDKRKKLVYNLSNKKKYVTHKFIKTSIKSWIKVKKDP